MKPNPTPVDALAQQPFNRLLMAAIAFTGALAFLQVYSIQSILPILRADFHASVVQAGNTVGATVLGVALMSPFMGMISDAVGRKALIVGSVLFMGLPTLGLALAQTIEHVLILRFLQGVAVPGITVVLLAYLGEEFDGPQRVRLMSLYVSGTVLGGFIGRFMLGYMTEWTGWRIGFATMAMINIVGTAFVWRQLPASRRFVPNPDFAGAVRMLKRHLRDRNVVSACALGFCVLFSLVSSFTYINLHLAQAPYHLNSAQLADIFAVYLVGMIVTPIAGRLIVRFGARPTVMAAIALSIAGMLLSLSLSLPLIVTALALMSTGVFITQSATLNYIAARVKQGRSLATGLYYMCYYLGGFAGSWLVGHAYNQGGWTSAVHSIIGVQCVALVIAAVLMTKRVAPT